MSRIERRNVSEFLDDLYNEQGNRVGVISRHFGDRPFVVVKEVTLSLEGAADLVRILTEELEAHRGKHR